MDKTVSSMMTSIFALEAEAPGFLRYLVPYLFDQMDDGDVESVLTDEWTVSRMRRLDPAIRNQFYNVYSRLESNPRSAEIWRNFVRSNETADGAKSASIAEKNDNLNSDGDMGTQSLGDLDPDFILPPTTYFDETRKQSLSSDSSRGHYRVPSLSFDADEDADELVPEAPEYNGSGDEEWCEAEDLDEKEKAGVQRFKEVWDTYYDHPKVKDRAPEGVGERRKSVHVTWDKGVKEAKK